MLGSVIRLCNLDPSRYKGHSFRIAATYAIEQGVSDDKIKHLGRWKSDAFKKYIRITSLESVRNNVMSGLLLVNLVLRAPFPGFGGGSGKSPGIGGSHDHQTPSCFQMKRKSTAFFGQYNIFWE